MYVERSSSPTLLDPETPPQLVSILSQPNPSHLQTHTHTHTYSHNTTPKQPNTTNHPLKHLTLSQLSLGACRTIFGRPLSSLQTLPSQPDPIIYILPVFPILTAELQSVSQAPLKCQSFKRLQPHTHNLPHPVTHSTPTSASHITPAHSPRHSHKLTLTYTPCPPTRTSIYQTSPSAAG